MRGGIADLLRHLLRAALGAFLLMGCITAAVAQEPPLDIPPSGVLTKSPYGISVDDWVLYPEIRGYATGSNNLYESPFAPVSAVGLGLSPKLVAEWSNGIHATTFYGNTDNTFYNQSQNNVSNANAGFRQSYSPLPDLKFSVQGDYTHLTVSGVVNSIPGLLASPGAITLANGNTALPNGTVVSPSGQVVGQINPALLVQARGTAINPTDTFTGLASVEKIFNHGIVNLTGVIAQTDYTQPSLIVPTQNYTTETFTGNAAFWLGPALYAFGNGTVVSEVFAQPNAFSIAGANQDTTSYTVRGGIGTRQIDLFRAAAYFGYQGSNEEMSGAAGGAIYGASLSYYPTGALTLTAAIDETINIASPGAASNLALSLPTQSALIVPLSSSTRITAPTLTAAYKITEQWGAFGTFGLVHVDFLNSPEIENAWLVDLVLRYQMSLHWSFNWEYQFTPIVANVPQTSSNRSYFYAGATYKF